MQKHNKNKGWSLLIFLIVLPLLMYGTYQYVLRGADSLPYYGMSQEEGNTAFPTSLLSIRTLPFFQKGNDGESKCSKLLFYGLP
jgi:hypothetical protein